MGMPRQAAHTPFDTGCARRTWLGVEVGGGVADRPIKSYAKGQPVDLAALWHLLLLLLLALRATG